MSYQDQDDAFLNMGGWLSMAVVVLIAVGLVVLFAVN